MKTENLCDATLESSVLSAFIHDNDEINFYAPDIKLFTGERALVYDASRKLNLGGNPVDLVTISTELKGQVKPSTISFIIDTPISHNLEYHLDQLDKMRIRREMAQSYSVGIQLCESGVDPDEIERSVKNGVSNTEKSEALFLADVAPQAMDDIESEAEGRRDIGIRCGIHPIDHATGGFEGGEFVVVAGRPGVGKTALALNKARNFGFKGIPGIIFSMEMSAHQLTRRLACDIGNIDSTMVFRGGYRDLFQKDKGEYQKELAILNSAMEEVSKLPILIEDDGNLTIDNIYSRAKKAKSVHNIKYVIIDHLGLVNGWTKEGQAVKNDITRTIKVMAKDLNIPVFVLCQMNRGIENRAEQIPKMSDLRDSGSIEQDADIVMFPCVPGELCMTSGGEGFNAFVQMGKNRRGAQGAVKDLFWQGHYYRYSYRPSCQ